MATQRRALAWPVVAALVVAAAGCGQARPDGDAAADTARALSAAATAGDGAAACAVLAPATRAALEESAGRPCPAAVTEEDLPGPGAVQTVDVYGQWAHVVTSGDTVFLGTFGDGWAE